MLVKAKAKGFDGSTTRMPGDVFEFEGKLGSWMEEIKDEADAPAKGKSKAGHAAKSKPTSKPTGDIDVI